jgi:MoxR-like ATPase
MEPTRQKDAYVKACLWEVNEVRKQVQAYRAQLLEHIAGLEDEIRAHLWIAEEFAEPASQSLAKTRVEVDTLLTRLDKVSRGFATLPREETPHAHDERHAAALQSSRSNKGRRT